MKFKPCISGQCTEDGTHCQGCHRSHVEIADTKQLIKDVVSFAQKMNYENSDDFADFMGKSVAKKLQSPSV
ncbi:MAG: DUF1289 domain-containing protein [Methylococcales bacterium]|nr:DUF1289 domain-containing protein [Methylococcales bacterium]